MTEPTPLFDQTTAALTDSPSTPTSPAVQTTVDNGTVTAESDDLDAQIIAAGKELVAAQRARPRDQARIDAARDALNALLALRDAAEGA